MDRHIGHHGFPEAIAKAIKKASSGNIVAQVEEALWDAFEMTLNHDRLLIVVDGLDSVKGGQPAISAILKRLHNATSKEHRSKVKAVVFTRPLSEAAQPNTEHFSIAAENSKEDITYYIDHLFSESRHFSSIDEKQRKSIATKLTEKAKGSFLWLKLVFESLKTKTTLQDISAYLEDVGSDTSKIIEKRCGSLDLKRSDTRLMLSWVLAAERPLTVRELKLLLEVDTEHCTHSRRFTSIEDDIRHHCGAFIKIQHGVLFLRYASTRTLLRQFIAKSVKSASWEVYVKDVHHELALRCLAYVKTQVHGEIEPRQKRLDVSECYEHFDKYELLEYSTRYWTTHIHSSHAWDANGDHKISASFKHCFPTTVLFSLLEATCIQYVTVIKEIEVYQSIGRYLRKAILGERSGAYLQSLVMYVRVCKKVQHKSLIEYSYEAWTVSKSFAQTTLILLCAEAFIQYSKDIKCTGRTEIVIRRERVLKFIIETHRQIHGASHELTCKYIRLLAQLYVSIHETQHAAGLYHELYLLTIERYGYFHKETTTIYEILITELKSISKFETILEIVQTYHEYVCKMLSVTDERRIKSTFELVKIYEERGEVIRAEETLVSFWKSITHTSSTVSSYEEVKIDVTIAYSRFLCRHSRREEAVTVMRGLWTEFSCFHEKKQSKTIIQKIKLIAEEFRSLKVTTVARSILTSLWSYFKKTEEFSSEEVTEVATSLAETIAETVTTTSTTTSTTLTVEEESTLREVFESSLTSTSTSTSTSSTKTTSISSSVVRTSIALASSYTKQERWSEAVEVYQKTLSRTWSSIETEEITEVSSYYSEELIQVALNLAVCRFHQLQIEKAQYIYANVLRALIRSSTHNHTLILETVRTIVAFHEKTYRFEKALSVYREAFVFFQLSLGKKHSTTVELLYSFAALALRLGRRKEAEEAYYEIYIAFVVRDTYVCKEAHKAAFKLCEFYDQTERWEVSRKVYGCLWQTFVLKHTEFSLGTEFVEHVYEKYVHVLQVTKVEQKVVQKIAVEYHKTCVEFYGEYHETTIKATVQLAEIYERTEEHREEAMTLYEKVLKHTEQISKTSKTTTTTTKSSTTSSTSTSTISIKKRLAQMYSSKTSTSTKAISLYQEQYESCVKEYGYSHSETLTAVQSIVEIYKKQSTKESVTKATTLLEKVTVEIFEKETHSERIIESARTVAKTYIECGFKETAVSLMHELRRKVIQHVRTSTTVESHSYSFFAAFSEVLVEKSSFSKIMSEIRTEVLLYEAYYRSVKTEKRVVSILEYGARLRIFLLEQKRTTDLQILETELFELFVKHLSVSHAVQQSIIGQFFGICLHHVSEDHYDEIILREAVKAFLEHTEASRFSDAYDLSLLIHRYIHVQSSFRSQANILLGFNLAMYLAGRRTKVCGDAKLHKAMLDQSKIILREALEGSRHISDFTLTDMGMSVVEELVILLGLHHNYDDLEVSKHPLTHHSSMQLPTHSLPPFRFKPPLTPPSKSSPPSGNPASSKKPGPPPSS